MIICREDHRIDLREELKFSWGRCTEGERSPDSGSCLAILVPGFRDTINPMSGARSGGPGWRRNGAI